MFPFPTFFEGEGTRVFVSVSKAFLKSAFFKTDYDLLYIVTVLEIAAVG